MDKIKIALCVCSLDGGVGQIILNYFDNMPGEEYEISIITQDLVSELYKKKFEVRNFKIYKVPSKRESLYKNMKDMYDIMKSNKFNIVHAHMTLTNFFPLVVAKMCGIGIRISHSHLAQKHTISSRFMAMISRWVATDYFACGVEAGKYLFGKKKFVIMNNAININDYRFNLSIRMEEREKYGVESDERIVGHIGRFSKQKNHMFLLNVFTQMYQQNNKLKLLLVGDGELLIDVKKEVEKRNISNHVIFTGAISDVHRKIQMMDLFILPSLYEGLSIAAVEAQVNGLPCVLSNRVSIETKINSNVEFYPLEGSLELWIKACMNKIFEKRIESDEIINTGFDIQEEADKLHKFYITKLEGEYNEKC
ncbi:MAG: glycosyltransferase family 1 protein [Lachnospiraceae bacterium]|nr:glycosyltransferase family 1 protein [Lachnospiraceae bacterium]